MVQACSGWASALLQIAGAIASTTDVKACEIEVYIDNEEALTLHLLWGSSISSKIAGYTEQLIKEKSKLLTYILGIDSNKLNIVHSEFVNSSNCTSLT